MEIQPVETIIGRKKEQKIFDQVLSMPTASFLAIYGRRRIGKTYLVENYFKNKGLFFHITGIQDAPLEDQLEVFNEIFCDHFYKGQISPVPASWIKAFNLLRRALEKIPVHTKIILFFDELPWLCGSKSKFLHALEYFWNRYFSARENLILIVCGSAASWMIDHIINAKGGLHGRITKEMRMLPFTLKETKEYLNYKNIFFDHKQILELYMCIGGIPKYLSFIERGKSVAQNMGDLCFSYNAPLMYEFNNLYRSLFKNYEEHKKIVAVLAQYSKGLSYKEVVEKTKLPTGGTLSKRLEELILSGFVLASPTFGKGKNKLQYILIDEYSLFYLSFIEKTSFFDLQSQGSDYWIKQRNSQAWRSWTGYSFEMVCLKHIECIKEALGLRVITTQTTSWKYRASKDNHVKNEVGAQIDLVIDRADSCIHLCELKYYSDEFVIDKEYASRLKKKKEIFERITQTKKSTFTTIITCLGVKHNDYYKSCVDQDLKMDIFFI